MNRQEDHIIEKTFSDIIREQMTETQFWDWCKKWLDEEAICNQAESWDLEYKKDFIIQWKADKNK